MSTKRTKVHKQLGHIFQGVSLDADTGQTYAAVMSKIENAY